MKLKIDIPLALIAGLVLFGACTKTLDAPLPVKPNGERDTAGNIRTVLRNSAFTLFNQAFVRAGLDSPYSFYTVFAPSDSAMTAAGLTSTVISSMSLDSLYNMVGYHLVLGVYPDSLLQNDTLTLEIPAVLVEQFETPNSSSGFYTQTNFQQDLFLSMKDVLYVNGQPSNEGQAPLRASNGWVYPVNRVLQPPSQTVWSILLSRPELSMYVAAERLVDSMSTASFFYYATVDSTLFSTVTYLNQNQTPEMFTVMAPTNDAFAKAGFNTVQDIRNYVNGSVPGTADVIPPGSTFPVVVYNYNAMDSVLKLHYLYNAGQNPVFYQDMLYSPNINDGWLNADSWYRSAYQAYMPVNPLVTPFYPRFAGQNGTVSIQWSDNPSIPAASMPLAAGSNFQAVNGVVYEIDQLFYPHN